MGTNLEGLIFIRNLFLVLIGISALVYGVAYFIIIRKRKKNQLHQIPLNNLDFLEDAYLDKKVQFTLKIYRPEDAVNLFLEQGNKKVEILNQKYETGIHFYQWENKDELSKEEPVFLVFISGKNKIMRKYLLK